MSGVCERVRKSLHRQLHICVKNSGGHLSIYLFLLYHLLSVLIWNNTFAILVFMIMIRPYSCKELPICSNSIGCFLP